MSFAESEVAVMEMVKRFEPVALFLIIIGALNWAIVSLFDTNVITEVFGTGTVTDVIYVLFGLSALVWVPRLMEELHLGHGAQPRGV
ncbi:MAG: hypothetical protein QOI10_1934 [Solirubrobacterales bacterium]|nr:hypothetical protein [Solirubrobacterales bacterium]